MGLMANEVGGVEATETASSQGRAGSRRILGIEFFYGGASEAVERIRKGGLLVVPSGPGLSSLPWEEDYREALLGADLAIADSGFMVLVWNLLESDRLARLSGLRYFTQLVADSEFRRQGAALYVMASEASARRNVGWLGRQGVPVEPAQVYIAPDYSGGVVDPLLVERIIAMRPRHIVITVGGGIQERLGLYIKRSVDYVPAIHCIGAAIAFRSGDQVYIPEIADKLHLGWLVRCMWRPRCYVPRYWAARKLAGLLYRYRAEMPPVRAQKQPRPEDPKPRTLNGTAVSGEEKLSGRRFPLKQGGETRA